MRLLKTNKRILSAEVLTGPVNLSVGDGASISFDDNVPRNYGTPLKQGDLTKIIQPVFSDGDGGIKPPPIIVKDPNYIGTENSDFQGIFQISSNVQNATVFVNGENTFKQAPHTLKIFASDVLREGSKTITLFKDQYKTNQEYTIFVRSNKKPIDDIVSPQIDYSINGYGDYFKRNDVIARDAIIKPTIAYTDNPRYIFTISKTENGQTQEYELTDPLNTELSFVLVPKSKGDLILDESGGSTKSVSILTQTPTFIKVSWTIKQSITSSGGSILPDSGNDRQEPSFGMGRLRRRILGEKTDGESQFGNDSINDKITRKDFGLGKKKLFRDISSDSASENNSQLKKRRFRFLGEREEIRIQTPEQNTTTTGYTVLSLKEGTNELNLPTGAIIRIESADINQYRITEILVNSIVSKSQPLIAKANQSLSTDVNLTEDLTIAISAEALIDEILDIPNIRVANGENERKYNINSNLPVPIGLIKTGTLTKLVVYVNNKELTFTELGDTKGNAEAPIMISIPSQLFDKIGRYKIIIVPFNDTLQGEKLEILYSVISETFVEVPDIFNITYPKEINGADYVGTDVNFEIKFESKNTQYVHLITGEYTQRVQTSGTLKLNLKDILEKLAGKVIENDTSISFSIKLVPVAESNKEVIKGEEEVVNIKFNKGKLFVPRAVALSRLKDSFEALLNVSDLQEDDSSKYLTHLLHLGNGDNKVITTWTGSKDSLILKLYEPIGTNVQPNDLVWISKPQSNPIIETVTLVANPQTFCQPIKGPNFTLEVDNGIGWSIFDDLLASGSQSSLKLINKFASGSLVDTNKLDVQFVSGSNLLFENFVNYSSAVERVNNFYYKVQLIESYKNRYDSIISGSASASAAVYTEGQRHLNSIYEIENNFDAFETFLYTDTEYDDTFSYPKYPNGSLKESTNNDSVAWLNYLTNLGDAFDKDNPNYLINNIPEFIKEDYNNQDFFVFLNMIGQHFDILWLYINGFARNKNINHKNKLGIVDDMVFHMLESFGWKTKKAYDSQFLWEYAFGLNKDGSQKYGRSLENANQEVWRRILNNLPYLLKHKGTGRAMKAIMACYGVPQSLLTIMEFGGPQDPTNSGVTQFTFDDRTAAIVLDETSAIKIPWHTYSTEGYPNGIEFRIKPTTLPNTTYTLISGSEWSLDLVQTTGSFGKLELNFGGDQSLTTYMETSGINYPYFDTSIEYVYGPDYKTGSLDFPISTEYYSNVAINRYNTPGTGSWYEVWLATGNGDRIITTVSMSLFSIDNQWETGSTLQIGGNGYNGNIDEFRLWRVPLQRSKFHNHTLFPDAIDGNSYTASTADLIFRLDFEYPKDRTTDNAILNVAINDVYAEGYATASNFYSASTYPYQYEPYERTVTANVPSTGYSFGNKIRFEDIQIETGKQLSHKVRATKKSFDRAPIDSNRLGIFFSPIKELNMDILKSFGDFKIDNYIGDPADEYNDSYKQLENLREYYFERLDRNINEYIQLVRYINRSLFDVLEDLAPARARISKGLLIEPHFLERSKHAWKRVETERLDYTGEYNINDNNKAESTYETKEAELDAKEVVKFDYSYDTYDSKIDVDDVIILEGTNPNYDGIIQPIPNDLIETEYPTYPPTGSQNIDCRFESTILTEIDAFSLTQIGMDKDSLSNAGFGLWGRNGVSKISEIDIFGNVTSSRQNVWRTKEQTSKKYMIQTEGWPATNVPGQAVKYEPISVTSYNYKITKLPLGSTLSTGGNVVEITKLNGYFPTHYRYVSNLSEGLQRSYFKGSLQTAATTPDGLDPVETFTTNPNILKVANTGRGSGEPILEVT
jgi:hypothetical protein